MRRRLMGLHGITATLISQPDAVAGDVCFYDSATDSKVFYRLDEGTDIIPETCTPIGVTVIPASHDVYGTGECGVMSLRYMSCDNPFQGSATPSSMIWGVTLNYPTLVINTVVITDNTENDILTTNTSGYLPIPQRYGSSVQCTKDTDTYYYLTTKHIPSPYLSDDTRNPSYYDSQNTNCLSDFNGVENTITIITRRGEKDYSSWSPTHNNSYDHPVASCCNMFSTAGTSQGDWYLCAPGEIGYYVSKSNIINASRQLISTLFPSILTYDVPRFFTSRAEITIPNGDLTDMDLLVHIIVAKLILRYALSSVSHLHLLQQV